MMHPSVHVDPFPHIVWDQVAPTELCRQARDEFDDPSIAWQTYDNTHELKLAARFDQAKGPAIGYFARWFQSEQWLTTLSSVFGMEGLTYDDLGGGLHRIKPGGHLDIHVDFNVHPDGRHRRLNCLLYLNDDPDPAADLFLRDKPTGHELEVRVRPLMGRCVVFATSDDSWHGHPLPLTGMEERRSLAAYYYTPSTDGLVAAHDTIFPGA